MQSIKNKVLYNNLINLFFIIILGTIAILAIFNLIKKEILLQNYYKQNAVNLKLTSVLNENSLQLLNTIYSEKEEYITELLARNEDIISVFEEYRSIANTFNLVEDISFALENENMIMDLRTNIVTCINLYRKGDIRAAREYFSKYIEPANTRITGFIDDIIYKKNIQIDKLNTEITGLQGIIIPILIISAGIILLINIVINFLLSASIVKPINNIINKVENISSGKGDLTRYLEIRSNDEIGLLARNFNGFITNLKTMVINLKTISVRTNKVGQNLANIATETSTNIVEISSTMISVKNIINELDREIQSSLVAMIQITAAIRNITGLIVTQSSNISESSSSIEEITMSIRNIDKIVADKKRLSETLSDIARDGLEKMNDSVESVSNVASSTNEILGMMEIINNVAKQTDLLSMNAAIEAAHAGEMGKGFSIVADEIKKLSEQTRINAKQINESLTKIISDINRAADTNRTAGEAFGRLGSGIQEVAGAMSETSVGMSELAAASNQILTALASLVTITEEIKNSTGEINQNAESISNNIQKISDISNQTLNSMEEISNGIVQVSDGMVLLADIGNDNEENIVTLNREIDQFKTQEEGNQL